MFGLIEGSECYEYVGYSPPSEECLESAQQGDIGLDPSILALAARRFPLRVVGKLFAR